MERFSNKNESKESECYVSFDIALRKLGQTQYISRFVDPNPKVHNDGTPYFEDIRTEGNPDDWHSFKIHKEDIKRFVEKWLEYKKETSPFFKKDAKAEDYL